MKTIFGPAPMSIQHCGMPSILRWPIYVPHCLLIVCLGLVVVYRGNWRRVWCLSKTFDQDQLRFQGVRGFNPLGVFRQV